jgi:hypothetical protein
MTYGCQAADAGTTLYAVHHGAIEGNQLIRPLTHGAGIPVFIALKLGIAWLLMRPGVSEGVRATVNVASCGVAAYNLRLAK